MKTATVSDFRAKMKERLNSIHEDQDILILSGPKKMDFVVLTLEAYNSMEETAHLLSSPANTARLLESISQDKAGSARVRRVVVDHARQSKSVHMVKPGAPKNRKRKPARVKQ